MSEDAYDVMIAADLEPQVSFRRSAAPWLSKCLRTGVLTSPAHSNIKRFGHQCVPCGLRKMSAASQHSDAEARARVPTNLVPQEPYPGSVLLPWKMFCTDCETLHDNPGLRLGNVSRRGSGCPNCGHHGIELDKPGYLYLIDHTGLDALKWGIANGPLRLKQHGGQGWTLRGRWLYDRARHARSVERQIGHWVKGQGIGPALKPDQMPYGGYGETASLRASASRGRDVSPRADREGITSDWCPSVCPGVGAIHTPGQTSASPSISCRSRWGSRRFCSVLRTGSSPRAS